ncbi:leucyl aminopeptidase family protein [Nocardioides sp. YIM 152315]|uniref:leucyl aminopeptidase family protein n=1 Tax=Nocardioides sp. YIM 152315 TaxID=3031760 RepID=UPI0023DA6EE2|nr:leucyl aminopeptidase family protein [Nocardioides sp. YIM 152315]MDF1603938.1 leucyl aminopeptidase family protein [Nocardioides sp. YIM 152315]
MPSTRTPTLPSQVSPPEFALSAAAPHGVVGVDVVALPVLPGEDGSGPVLGPGATDLSDLLGLDLLRVLEVSRATGEAGEVTTVPVPLGTAVSPDLTTVLLVGVGAQRHQDFRRAGAALARAARDRSAVATSIPSIDPDAVTPFVVGATLGSFLFHWRSKPPEHVPPGRIVLADVPDDVAPTLDRAVAIGGAAWLARMLATVPANLKNPAWLAAQAQEVAEAHSLDCTIWDEQRLAAEGFGGVLGVGQGSASPPRLIRLDYAPRRPHRRTPTVVLVGKGITFDTGGLSLKPGQSMTTMKRDMTGGAVVIATMAALRAVGCPVRVIGLVPAAENSVGANSLRPGDVLRHYGGRTSEVTNTDAEGRLVLADAIAYAVSNLDPAVVVDVATLTGAVKVALGQQVGGLFANDDALAGLLRGAAEVAGEPLWRFPLTDSYEGKLSSTVADADNAPGGPGAIVAALFLQHFVDDVPWAHLDIASVGDSPEDAFEWTPGPTGFGARALLEWLGSPEPLAGVGG